MKLAGLREISIRVKLAVLASVVIAFVVLGQTFQSLAGEAVTAQEQMSLRARLVMVSVAGAVTNAAPPALDRWIELVSQLRPIRVQVTTVERGTSVPGVLPVPAPQLLKIVERLETLGISADAYPCSNEDRFQ